MYLKWILLFDINNADKYISSVLTVSCGEYTVLLWSNVWLLSNFLYIAVKMKDFLMHCLCISTYIALNKIGSEIEHWYLSFKVPGF